MSDLHIERKRRALEIFDEVADLDVDAREQELHTLCADDPDLRAQVQALLDADAHATEPFHGNAAAWGSALDAAHGGSDTGEDAGTDALLGRSLGVWRIVEIIGRGGMGAVYAVQRSDGAYAQQAALKLIRTSADSPAARERFLRERQILARLQHANIATLLDGGISAEGEPYFVMERVDGVPIDQWCDTRALGLRERVVLFLQVLDAVRFAHRNLVVHRDLKPSNLLVDGDGHVKLLDFGIAKQLEASDVTATHDRALTFEYASPEQLHDAPITTATDLWQVGVVLHRLLSGAHPFGLSRDTPVAKQLQQLEREPEPLTRAAAHSSLEQAAQRGGHSPASLARALRGNLAEVVQACLRRDPEARYASADALAGDLRAWLDDRPIAAVRLSRRERSRLWLRRNRGLAASIAAVAIALLAGTGVALWQAHEASAQARIAEREAANARASLAFLTDTLSASAPEQTLDTQISVRQLLDNARRQLQRRNPHDLQVRQPVQRMLGHLYNSLGEPKIAVELFEQGLKNLEPQSKTEALALALDIDGFASALAYMERGKESLVAAERSAVLRARFAPDDIEQRLLTFNQFGLAYLMSEDVAKAEQQWSAGLALAKTVKSPPAAAVIQLHVWLGDLARDFKGDYQRSLDVADAGLEFARQQRIPVKSPLRVSLLRVRGSAMDRMGETAKAVQVLQQAIDIQAAAVGPGGNEMSQLYNDLGISLNRLGRYRDGLKALQRAQAVQSVSRDSPMETGIGLANLAWACLSLGDYAQAESLMERATASLDLSGIGKDHLVRRKIERIDASLLVAAGRYTDADPLLRHLRERARTLDGPDSDEYASVLKIQMFLSRQTQDEKNGELLVEEVLTRWSKLVPATHPVFIEIARSRAAFALMRGDTQAAERNQREAMTKLESSGVNQTSIAVVRAELAGIRLARGDKPGARKLLDQALPVLRASLLPQEINRKAAEVLQHTLSA